jgi:hypothetical protein
MPVPFSFLRSNIFRSPCTLVFPFKTVINIQYDKENVIKVPISCSFDICPAYKTRFHSQIDHSTIVTRILSSEKSWGDFRICSDKSFPTECNEAIKFYPELYYKCGAHPAFISIEAPGFTGPPCNLMVICLRRRILLT